jgi:hypothetical protein
VLKVIQDNLGGAIPPIINNIKMEENELQEMEQFQRIANARLRKKIRFKPQRRAVIAKMYRDWKEKKEWSNAWENS